MTGTTSPRFTIGTLAKRADVAIDTIRYYEREQLLPSPERKASGYREYDAAAVERVRFIRRAKELGFTLQEIRDLLALESDRVHGVEGVRQRAIERLQVLDLRIAQMSEIRAGLAQLVDACPGQGAPESCPILSSMRGVEAGDAAPHAAATSCCAPAKGKTRPRQ